MPKRRYDLGHPHLLRRRGKTKFWTAWLNGHEISLGTADRVEAQRRLDARAAQRTLAYGLRRVLIDDEAAEKPADRGSRNQPQHSQHDQIAQSARVVERRAEQRDPELR